MIRLEYIYILTCPITKEIRYVGKTIDPKARLSAHVSATLSGKNKNERLAEWIMTLNRRNLLPILTVVKEYDLNYQIGLFIYDWESHYFDFYKQTCNLLNKKNIEGHNKTINFVGLEKRMKEKGITKKLITEITGISTGSIKYTMEHKKYSETSYNKKIELRNVILKLIGE